MKQLLSCILLAFMLLPAASTAIAANPLQTHTLTQTITFDQPQIRQADGYSTVTIDNTNSCLTQAGAPNLPSQLLTYTFPLGTTITSITVNLAPAQTFQLTADLKPIAPPQTIVDDTIITAPLTAMSPACYPEPQWTYHLGAGLQEQKHTLFLNIRCTPVQYHQASRTISYSPQATVTVEYTDPASSPFPLKATYDLVIIAPEKFTAALQPLVNHKNAHGVTTLLVARETICNNTNYSQGRDCAEKMKYFIKDCIEQYGTSNILLVGGRSGGIMKEKWWMPVRYSHLDDESGFEGSYLSDLYFADIYNPNLSFSSWDTNGDGIFAEWNSHGKDILDMFPDVAVGRLACKDLAEVKVVVNKIVTYENGTAGADWFKTMVVAGGDSAPYSNDSWYEGEEENKLAISYMTSFTPVKFWTSDGTLTGRDDLISAVSQGCGFLFVDGHGNPQVWTTHPPNSSAWVGGLNAIDMFKMTNREKLPIIVCGACHNAQFNVSLTNIIKRIIQDRLLFFQRTVYYKDWVPECWAWRSVSVARGGSVATMAYAGLDWFTEGDGNHDGIPDCVQFFSGFMNTNFFYNYGVRNLTRLGDTFTQDLTDYLNAFPPMVNKLDCKTVQEFTLLGDPTLAIGGYS